MRLAASFAALALVACDPPTAMTHTPVIVSDGGVVEPPQAPTVTSYPAVMPYRVMTLHGRALNAKRVIAFGTANPTAVTVLPDGNFCMDIPIAEPGEYALQLVALNDQGQMSSTSTEVRFSYDPIAPTIDGAATCSGADPAGCTGQAEICDNHRDDDCDGRTDAADSDCAACTDDALEQNDDVNAPTIEPRSYYDLVVCPNDEDFYKVFLRSGETLNVRILFDNDQGDLDLRVLRPNGDFIYSTLPDGGMGAEIGVSESSNNDFEMVSYTAPTEGRYIVWVYGYAPEGADPISNTYTLELSVAD